MTGKNDAAIGELGNVGELSSVPQRADAARALALVLAYFLAYVLVRLVTPGALDLDEAEIVYLTQELRPGYGTQPPLYAWLQWCVFSVFGIDRFALVILKALALAAAYVAMYHAGRPLVGRNAALAAAASLALFPQIGWETLRIQTHSVLLVTLACATLACYVALLRKPDVPRYALLGLLCGLGLQTKYNFGVFLAGIACASLLVPEHRRQVWNRKLWISALLVLLLLMPHAVWMATHLDAAFAGTVEKMQAGVGRASYPQRVLGGLASVLSAAFSFTALPVLVYAAVCWPWRREAVLQRRAAASRFFLVMYAAFGLMLAALALSGQVGTMKERWMIPLLFSLPLALFVMAPGLRTRAVCVRVRRVAGAVALLWLLLLPARIWLGPALGQVAVPHHPYAQLAEVLRERCPTANTIVTESLLSAGNLRFERPELRTRLLADMARDTAPLSGRVVLLTHTGAEGHWRAFQDRYPGARTLRQERVQLPLRFGGAGTMRFEFACLELPVLRE
jgi:4-amino-4-deoxy-L-arabinose transferase-like glycosyltransferase